MVSKTWIATRWRLRRRSAIRTAFWQDVLVQMEDNYQGSTWLAVYWHLSFHVPEFPGLTKSVDTRRAVGS